MHVYVYIYIYCDSHIQKDIEKTFNKQFSHYQFRTMVTENRNPMLQCVQRKTSFHSRRLFAVPVYLLIEN